MKRRLLTIPGHAHTIECVLYDTLCALWESQDRGCHFVASYESLFNGEGRPPTMGRVHLPRGIVKDIYFYGGLVAHELMHAVLDAGFALNADKTGDHLADDTEALCEMMGDLTAQFWRWHRAPESI